MANNRRILYLDLLNITASFCVVAMHCNGIVHFYSESLAWKQSLIVEVLAYWAVPIFFMLSGATLLNYHNKYSTRVFIIKRVSKTLIPFCVWSMIAFFYKCIVGIIDIGNLSVKEFISMFINCKIENIYWFFIPLFAVYLCIPVLSCMIKESDRYLEYMAILGVVTISVVPFVCNALEIPFNTAMSFPMTGGYVLYVILGYLLSKIDIPKGKRIVIYLLGMGGALARYCGTYFMSIQDGELNKLFWGYLNWPALLLSIAVFIWFRYHDWSWLEEHSKVKSAITKIAGSSFGVYLIHIFVINFMCSICKVNVFGWKWRTIGVILVYGFSLIIVKFLKNIPVMKRIVP